MKKLIFLILSCFTVNLYAQTALNIDPLIETNLTDELNTPIKFRKSKNYNIDSLSRLSRLTDTTVRRPRKMRTKNMSIFEMVDAPKVNINNTDFYFYKNRFVNSLTTKNIFINELISRFNISINSQNIVQNTVTDINVSSYNNLSHFSTSNNMMLNLILGDMLSINSISTKDNTINSMLCNMLQIQSLNFNMADLFDMSVCNTYGQEIHNIDQTVYVIDQSAFSIEITEEILRELNNDTRLYAFKNSQQYSVAYLKDFEKLKYEQQIKWLNVFENHKTCNIEWLKPTKIPKIIGEIKLERDEYPSEYDFERLNLNIKILKSRGYDSILFRFYVGQNIEHIIKLLEHIKSFDLDIYVVYTGLDNRKPEPWNPFVDSDELEKCISMIAPYATGWLLNWRSMSQHVKLLPKEFFNYLCNTVRTYNKNCMIYGEIYYGQIDPLRTNALMYNIPQNVSGVIINNMGFYGYNHAFIVNKLFAKTVPNYKSLAKIAQVVGYRPYYSSRHNLYLSIDEEYDYKHKIENNFRRVKCGTITFIHDGVDDNYAEEYNIYQSQDNILYDYKLKNLIKEN